MVKLQKRLDRTFAALADPTRRAILDSLSTGEAAPVSVIAAPFAMSLPAVMKHLSVLETAGLLTCRKTGRVRTCRIDPKGASQMLSWIKARESVWQQRLDSLQELVDERGQ
ncbi:MAG TPA: metalloregulator ArsR/SmtB family transcription factor [Actinomycetota bacterium]|nr:metalloregulator ArsR/SmtB family transcription factor [Actinomycetota bacterium]